MTTTIRANAVTRTTLSGRTVTYPVPYGVSLATIIRRATLDAIRLGGTVRVGGELVVQVSA